jgi:acetoin utilization protein AcuB
MSALKAADCMTRRVVCLSPQVRISTAYAIMNQYGFRHIPIVEAGILTGIVSDRDILSASLVIPGKPMEIPSVTLGEIATPHPVTCRPDTTVSEIAALMIAHQIDSIPIIDLRGALAGLVTSVDLLELLRDQGASLGGRVLPFRFEVTSEPAFGL